MKFSLKKWVKFMNKLEAAGGAAATTKAPNSFDGIAKVAGFTFSQLFKNKSNLISFGAFIVAALVSVPVMSIFMGDSGETQATFYTSIMTMAEFMEQDQVGFEARYFIQYAYSIVVMMITLFSCTFIVRAILEEKSSKLVETLLVSIKSEAMILGKILAIIAFVFVMFSLIFIAFALSYFGTSMFTDVSFVGDTLSSIGITSELLNIGLGTLAIILVSLILACVLLSQIAALSGAGCSNMEDMESANMTATMLILAAYFVALFSTAFGDVSATVVSLIPFVSAFAAPACYVIGDIKLGVLLVSWVIQAVCIFIVHKLSGKVYDSLIMYNGKRLKMRQILAMAMRGKDGSFKPEQSQKNDDNCGKEGK